MTPWFSFSSPSVRELMLFLSRSMKIWERWGRGDVSKRERKWKEEMLSGVRKEKGKKQNISLSLSCCGSHNKQGRRGIFFSIPATPFMGNRACILRTKFPFGADPTNGNTHLKKRDRNEDYIYGSSFSICAVKKPGRPRWVFPRQKLILPETSATPTIIACVAVCRQKRFFFEEILLLFLLPLPFGFLHPAIFSLCLSFLPTLCNKKKPWFFFLRLMELCSAQKMCCKRSDERGRDCMYKMRW